MTYDTYFGTFYILHHYIFVQGNQLTTDRVSISLAIVISW